MADDRVLLLLPHATEAGKLRQFLAGAGLIVVACTDVEDLCLQLDRGAEMAIVSEQAMASSALKEALTRQPSWSDFPLIVLADQGAGTSDRLEVLPATRIERPLNERLLLTVIRVALRARRHQYAMRDQLAIIRKEQERYRVILSSIGDAVIATDADGRVSYMNKVAESLTGWTQDAAAGKPLSETFHIVHEHTRKQVDNPALHALRSNSIVGLANHTMLISLDGTERPIDDSAAPIREEGKQVGAVLVFRDVSERKQAEEIRARLAAIVESSDDAIVGKTLDGIIRSWNEGASRLFGYSAAEAIGQPITLIIPPERHGEEKAIIKRLRAGERIEHFETVRVTKEGRFVDISLTVSPIRNAEGDVVGASKIARDITGKKRDEAERGRLAETLGLAVVAAELGTWDWDPATDSMTISERAGEIYGIRAGTYRREGLRQLIHPSYRDKARREAARALAERCDYNIEYLLQSGTWISAHGRGVYDASGTTVRMLGVVADVTARKRSELALRESEAFNRMLVNLTGMTQSLTEPKEIMAASARVLADHLEVDRCAYAEVENELVYVITGDYTRGDAASITGRWEVSAFGLPHLAAMQANEPYVVDDVETDARITAADRTAFHATNIGSVICVPLFKGGKFTAAMAVHQKTPRRWTEAEIRLVTAVASRCWETLERARVARELGDIRSRMESALEAGTIGTWAWDVQQDRFYGDNSLAHIFGVTREAVSGGPLAGLLGSIHPDDRERVGALVNRALAEGGAYEADYRVRRVEEIRGIHASAASEATQKSAGTLGKGQETDTSAWRWITARGQVELDSEGKATRFPGVVIDITERKSAEEALARVTEQSDRMKRLYETALSNTPDLVYVFGLDHSFYYANDALLKMWGKSWDEAIGKTCLELGYEPWHASKHDEEIEQVVATKKPIRGEVPFTGTNGRRVYDYIFVPVFGANGEVEAVAGTTRDITDRQAMEEELREADRKKDDFIALLAHELRNPLAPIRNGLQVMRLAGNNQQILNEARLMMDRQLGHMVRLIDDLLDVSRISRNKMELRRGRVPLADVVASAVETARPLIDGAGHELTISLPANPVFLDADLTRMAQVFSNLLTNSAKYTPPGGRVWLTAKRKDGQVEISVRDSGIGIPTESLEHIFDMFSQVDRSIERSTGGLGIGLALVKGLVEMHGGTVAATSDGEGKGSMFTVTLPVLAGPTSPTQPHQEGARGPSRRFLVVDDNRDGADSLAMALRFLGEEVRTAYDGAEAVELAEQFRPEVILMDVGMPRINGLDATRRIRTESWGRDIKIIALTGWGQSHDRERSREAGCDGHLVKPVNLVDLDKMLAELKEG